MKNIHILPTDKPSRLHTYKGILNLAADEFVAPTIVKNDLINLNIYITSDEEIKEEDWCVDTYKLKNNHNPIFKWSDKFKVDAKKIILTTDQDLIKDGIQAIDDEFLEWFVQNPSCEEVEIINEQYTQNYHKDIWYNRHKIMIPKEEPKQEQEICNHCGKTLREQMKGCGEITCYRQFLTKQETLEEAAEREYPTIHEQYQYDAFIDGAKWMKERMYSEKEVESLLHKYMQSQIPDWHGWSTTKWFEQFKKK
tara:strand:- start:1264 stop:2019 length:756 start_codon:yes stop_codon:yes gene_type:complete